MITKLTCEAIWHCYREIEMGEKLLMELAKTREDGHLPKYKAPELKDSFGRRRSLQLGVPSGESGHTLHDVAPHLAESVIAAHIAQKRAELVALHERARLELDTDKPEIPK